MKLLIAVDMEGISGVVSWDHIDPSHPEYQRFRHLMTADVNAAITGAAQAGVTEFLVVDGHWNSTNILIEELDRRASLQAGSPSPFSMVEGVQHGVDGVFFIGYHARVGTPDAILDHTWSSTRVQNLWLNGRLTGETGLNGAVCGAFGTPVLLVTGDQAVCAEAVEWLPGVETVQTKRATGRHSAECLPLAVSQEAIRQAAELACRRFLAGQVPALLKLASPVEVVIEFTYSDMADRATLLPGSTRLDGHRLRYEAPDMPAAYLAFRAAVTLSNR